MESGERSRKSDLLFAILVCFTCAFTVLYFAPLLLYLKNSRDFLFPLAYLLLWLVPPVLLVGGIMTLVVFRLKGAAYVKSIAAIFCVSILFWIQGSLLPWAYGQLDGSAIDWGARTPYGIADTPLWVASIGLALWKAEWVFRRILRQGCLFLLASQFLLAVFLFSPESETASHKNFAVGDREKYSLSPESNIVLLVLDSFPGDVFQEILETHPSLADPLDGFVFFRNASAEYPYTETSTFNLLTGERFDFNLPFQPQVNHFFRQASLPQALARNDYRVEIYPFVRCGTYFDERVFANITRRTFLKFEDAFDDFLHTYRLSFFLGLPHFLKMGYFPALQDKICGNYFNQVKSFHEAVVDSRGKGKIFKLFHLPLPHSPLILDENLSYHPMEFNRENFKRQSIAALKAASRFLAKLEKEGIYDRTMIFIVGDHGGGSQGLGIRIPPDPACGSFSRKTYLWQATGAPLILAKPFRKRGGLTRTDDPVSLGDLRDTILQEVNLSSSGNSIFRQGPQPRERTFFLYGDYDRRADRYLPRWKFKIRGHVWDSQSWIPDHAFHPAALKSYAWGETIRFGKTGSAERYKFWHGFSIPEEGFTWTEGNVASMGLRISPPRKDLVLKLKAWPLTGENRSSQRISIRLNDRLMETWMMDKDGEYTLEIPREIIREEVLEIVFSLPDAVSPKEIGINQDERLLAMAVKSLVIEEKDPGKQ
jgi:hypothetical protein